VRIKALDTLERLALLAISIGVMGGAAHAGTLYIDGCPADASCGLYQYTTDSSGQVQASTRSLYNGQINVYMASNAAGSMVAIPNDARNCCNYIYPFDQISTGTAIYPGAVLAGGLGTMGKSIAEDSAGDVFGSYVDGIWEVAAGTDAISQWSAATVAGLGYFAIDNSGNLWGSDGHTIYEYSLSGIPSVFATDPVHGAGITSFGFDTAGDLIAYNSAYGTLYEWNSSGAYQGELVSGMPGNDINGYGTMAIDPAGDVVFGGFHEGTIYEYNALTQSVSTFDNFDLDGMTFTTAQVPEPSTWILTLAATGLLFGKSIIRRKRSRLP
jgi:hypothetical protein